MNKSNIVDEYSCLGLTFEDAGGSDLVLSGPDHAITPERVARAKREKHNILRRLRIRLAHANHQPPQQQLSLIAPVYRTELVDGVAVAFIQDRTSTQVKA